MVGSSEITVEITNNKKVLKQIKETVDFKSNFKDYISVLRSTQKLVNSALTEIVDQEKSDESIADEEDDEDEDSDVEKKPNSTAKRKSEIQKHSKRVKN